MFVFCLVKPKSGCRTVDNLNYTSDLCLTVRPSDLCEVNRGTEVWAIFIQLIPHVNKSPLFPYVSKCVMLFTLYYVIAVCKHVFC